MFRSLYTAFFGDSFRSFLYTCLSWTPFAIVGGLTVWTGIKTGVWFGFAVWCLSLVGALVAFGVLAFWERRIQREERRQRIKEAIEQDIFDRINLVREEVRQEDEEARSLQGLREIQRLIEARVLEPEALPAAQSGQTVQPSQLRRINGFFQPLDSRLEITIAPSLNVPPDADRAEVAQRIAAAISQKRSPFPASCQSCQFYSGNPYLRCAVRPTGLEPDQDCPDRLPL